MPIDIPFVVLSRNVREFPAIAAQATELFRGTYEECTPHVVEDRTYRCLASMWDRLRTESKLDKEKLLALADYIEANADIFDQRKGETCMVGLGCRMLDKESHVMTFSEEYSVPLATTCRIYFAPIYSANQASKYIRKLATEGAL